MLSHAGAYLRPMSRQITQSMVLRRIVGKDFLSEAAWSRNYRHTESLLFKKKKKPAICKLGTSTV